MAVKQLLYALFYTESLSLYSDVKMSPQFAQSQIQVSP